MTCSIGPPASSAGRVSRTGDSVTAPVAHVSLDDGKANALNDASIDALLHGIDRARADGAGVLVIRGRSGVFSGGIDLGVLRGDDPQARLATLIRIARGLLAVWTAPIPTVAAVTGHAIAGGAVLAMACDQRIALDDADHRIGVNETALGMAFPTWALVICRSAIRPERLTETMLLGRTFAPSRAAETGIVERAVAPADFDTAVEDAAAEAAALPTAAYARTKLRLREAEKTRAEALIGDEMGTFGGPT
ncbi:MAG TPA: enoyl-CoA hydratase/isomerase family protein [Acidimicrobiia bacterium]|nr:enoyl-CoA hydratase/isomerase family protein [Acidimicrobiia bacterium]